MPVPPERDSLAYRLLHRVARLALHWYYRQVTIDGAERIPRDGPVLMVVNHPNELLDVLFAGIVSPRQLTFTGNSTLFANPVQGAFLRYMRVVPLRRTQDERAVSRDAATPDVVTPDIARNADAFAAIHDALAAGRIVLIFPEGRSWDEPRLAPMKTGAARIALSAGEAGVRGVTVVPIGINYERKDGLRSRVLVQVAPPIVLDTLRPDQMSVDAITREIGDRLRAVTLNFDDHGDADEVLDLATTLAAATDEIRPLGDPDAPMSAQVDVARRAAAIRQRLERGELPSLTEQRVRRVQRRLLALQRTATRLGIRLDDVALDTRLPAAGRFVIRELLLGAIGIPFALWGRVNHFLPFTLATWLGRRNATARSQLAMRTIVLGVLLVPLFYLVQTLVVWRFTGAVWAALYVASLVPSASWDIRYRERVRGMTRRARAWRHFRDDPALQAKLRNELVALRDEATTIASGASAT